MKQLSAFYHPTPPKAVATPCHRHYTYTPHCAIQCHTDQLGTVSDGNESHETEWICAVGIRYEGSDVLGAPLPTPNGRTETGWSAVNCRQ